MKNEEFEQRKIMGFNRKCFVEEILNIDFNGDLKQCSIALKINPGYLNDLIYTPSKDAGTKTLTKIWHYCQITGRNPEKYVFKMPE